MKVGLEHTIRDKAGQWLEGAMSARHVMPGEELCAVS
jgi:hypothetical protein